MGIPISPLGCALPDVENAKLSHCYDGDTCTFIVVRCDCVLGNKIVVRIRGIDKPELQGKGLAEKERPGKPGTVCAKYSKEPAGLTS